GSGKHRAQHTRSSKLGSFPKLLNHEILRVPLESEVLRHKWPGTKETGASVDVFLAKIAGEERRRDCVAVVKLMSRASGARPKMWGAGIVGFGSRRLKYESGRELDWFPVGFASRKQDIALYGLLGGEAEALLDKLGKHSRAKG